MPTDGQKSTGTLYVWKNEKTGKWYRTGISPNGKVSVPSQAYTRRGTAEDLTPVENFLRNPRVVYGRPPRGKK
jgi:hypothetical protein